METVTQISKRTDLTHKHGHEIYRTDLTHKHGHEIYRTDLTHKHGHEIYHIFYQVQQVFLYFPPPI